MSDAAARVYGEGWVWPLEAAPNGQLRRSAGEDRVWQAVEEILQTPLGSRPLDPTFGTPLAAFDPITDVTAVAWLLGLAIDSCEPRVVNVRVEILGASLLTATLYLRLVLTLRAGGSELVRTFPFYRKVT